MRIRKHASKILGTASLFPSDSPPRAASQIWSPWSPLVDNGLACQLNQSSWDVMPFLPSPALNHLSASTQAVEKEVEHWDNTGNGIKCKENPTFSKKRSTAVASMPKEAKEEGDKVSVERKANGDKKKRITKEKGKHSSKAASLVSTHCKKSDGKTWKCNRRAKHPHTLCEYHLSQLRSYNSKYKLVHKVEAPRAQVGKRWRTLAGKEVGSNFLYYYYGFGPWRGKRRVGDGEGTGGDEATKEEEKQEELGWNENLVSEDGNHARMVVDDDACKGQDDADYDQGGCGDIDGDDSMEKDHSDKGEQTTRNKTDNPRHEKRRKRIKARSLKSIL